MISAFCPGHISCIFRPADNVNILKKGSRGVGIRTSAGTIVEMNEILGSTKVFINGKESEARITRHTIEHMAPDRNFEVYVECQLPTGQGFGMSASGALCVALCVAEVVGKERQEAYEAAHIADISCDGGLGDVAALTYEGDVPIRVKEGIPPFGILKDPGFRFDELNLVIFGPKLSTASVLSDPSRVDVIRSSGDKAIDSFLREPTKENLFLESVTFAKNTELMVHSVHDVIAKLQKNGMRASMCMLGNSIFTDSPKDEITDVLGNDIEMYSLSSTNESPKIIRKG